MMTPLALDRRGRHFTFMKRSFFTLVLALTACSYGSLAHAQLLPDTELSEPKGAEVQPPPQSLPSEPSKPPADAEPPLPEAAPAPDIETQKPSLADGIAATRPDIIITSEAERAEKLLALFEKLKATEDPDDANLVAEEIWAIWLRSGSASINFVLARGADAQKRGNLELAGRMFDHVVRLNPDYAEGWVRSGRLALEQGDLSRAVSDCLQGLIHEPRHFYAWWTLGNIFEQLGQREAAFEAYNEAAALYPALKAVSDRIDYLSAEVEGESL